MRIARYLSDGRAKVGIVEGDAVHEVPGGEVVDLLTADRPQTDGAVPLADVELLAPMPRPPKFLGVGLNSMDHLEEAKTAERTPVVLEALRQHQLLQEAFPDARFPLLFNKQVNSICGPHDQVWIPRDSEQVDYEGEVAIVIGTPVRRADEAAAAAAIGGWTVTNDVSVRDWQSNTSQLWLGKSFDTHGPIGPWIVTADEFDPSAATIKTWVNGDLRQDGKLADQILTPAAIVAAISQICTLEPGDLIATGTPAGTGVVTSNWVKLGDRVRIEVSGIGTIENEFVAEPVEAPAEGRDAAAV